MLDNANSCSGLAEKKLELKVHLCWPLYLCSPLHLHGPLCSFRVALLHLYNRAFHYYMGPFHPVSPHGGGFRGCIYKSFIHQKLVAHKTHQNKFKCAGCEK